MDYTSIIVSFIGACAMIITGVLIPLLINRYGAQRVESVMAKFEVVYSWAKAAAAAAEVLFAEAGKGDDKRDYVTKYITDMCARYGITIDMDSIRQAIEKACRELGFVK
jgi:LL-H family phage holin